MSDILSVEEKPLCVQQLGEFNHKEFIAAVTFTESNRNNLNELTKVANYFRQVIPVYISVLESIRSKSILLAQKHTFLKEDVKKSENGITELEENTNKLIEKVIKIQETQRDLIDRIQCLDLSSFDNKEKELSFAEEQYFKFLKVLNGKVKMYKNDMNSINSKLNVVKNSNNEIENKHWFLKESQINIVKSHLFEMNKHIEFMHKKLADVESTFSSDDFV